jgi:4-hydroxy-2-oxoheptanedioate aldolase
MVMNLPVNEFKAALRSRQTQIGIWSSLSDPTVAELLAGCGL